MTTQGPPLVEILADIPDPRQEQGKRYPLSAMLSLMVVGVLCGYQTIKAIAEWGSNSGEEYADQLGFNEHGYPAQASWYRVLRLVDVELFEEKVRRWAEGLLMPEEGERLGLSIDGKTLRVSKKMGACNSHLLSAVAHEIGVVVGQWAVDDHTNEIGMMKSLLRDLVLEGLVVTTDGLLTQKDVARTIVAGGGDYVLPVKDNQPATKAAIAEWFAEPPAPYEEANPTARRVEKGHDRLAIRRLETTTVLNDYLDWKGLAQAFKLTRRFVHLSTGEVQEKTLYGITSLSAEEADPQALLTFIQHHWTIENKLHWVKDVTLDEDRCQLRKGRTHHLMALFRNLALSLLRLNNYHNIASSLRTFAAQPDKAVQLVTCPIGER
jgi:predicted transposase YbfD/YdcC